MSSTDLTPSISTDCPITPKTPVTQRIETRRAVLGEGLTIHRALPAAQRRMVGAWCFLDHAGPMVFEAGKGMKVGPHPHIGLQTFTWMIEGEVLHQDSLGYEQMIRPGEVNLMTAGCGITHAENSSDGKSGTLHLAQLWIALPESHRHMEPAFQHYAGLPHVHAGGFDVTVLVGAFMEKISPVTVYAPMLGADITCQGNAEHSFPLNPSFEHAILVLEGSAQVEGEALLPGTLLYLGTGREQIALQSAYTRLLIIGGTPFEEERIVWWNFVAVTHEEIEKAANDWQTNQYFKEVPGATGERLTVPDLTGIVLKPRR